MNRRTQKNQNIHRYRPKKRTKNKNTVYKNLRKRMKRSTYLTGFFLVFTLTLNAQNDEKGPVRIHNGTALTDSRDGNTYKVVKIGDQIWMAENLKYLPNVVGPETGSKRKPFYYVQGYDGTKVSEAMATRNYEIYGVLYNWPAAMNEAKGSTANPSGVQGVCPCGWHLPSDAEWTQMTDYLNINVAGGKLKDTSAKIWNSPNTGASNETGFTALAGGYRKEDGTFVSMGEDSDFWSASERNCTYAWFRNIHFNDNDVGRNNFRKEIGFSVRCVKD